VRRICLRISLQQALGPALAQAPPPTTTSICTQWKRPLSRAVLRATAPNRWSTTPAPDGRMAWPLHRRLLLCCSNNSSSNSSSNNSSSNSSSSNNNRRVWV
jgi:hypothetical protein